MDVIIHNDWTKATGLTLEGPSLAVVREAFAQDGIVEPSAVQRVAIAPILEGKNVVVHSGTGTGKTLAYLLPILQRLRENPNARAVILAPSPELALQTLRIAERYRDGGLELGALVSTASHKHQRGSVQKSTRLIVGTPGRVLERYAKRKLKGVTMMVLDEPDPILAGKDASFLLEVMSRPEPKLQIIMAGATLGVHAQKFIDNVLGENVVRAYMDASPLHEDIDHYFVGVKDAKDVRVARFIEANACRRVIIFVNKAHLIGHLYRYLSEHRLKPVSLSQERPRNEQRLAIHDFSSGKARVLITTDKTARGLDIADVEWIVHYELPHSPQAYLHRAGRSGRQGKHGRSVVFCLPKERQLLKTYARELKLEFVPFEGKER